MVVRRDGRELSLPYMKVSGIYRGELEEFLACDPETVSIHLAALAQEGLIRYIKGSSRAIRTG